MTRERWDALDDLRGLAVFVMVPVNVAAPFLLVPGWFKHAPADGLTIADLVVPVFLFSLGLSAAFSYRRRKERDGWLRTLRHALLRSVLLFAFGTAGILMVDHGSRWEILQMLGATGLFSFFFLLLRPWPRLAAAACLLAVVEVLRPLGLGALMGQWDDSGIAGPWGTFSLSFFAITASALGELTRDATAAARLRLSATLGVILCAGGVIALAFFPFSKHLLSLSYVLFTAGIASALLAILVIWRELLRWPLPVLGSLGRNPLLLYMLHAVLGVAVQAILPSSADLPVAWAASLGVLAVCCAVALLLDRRRLYLKI